MPEMSLPIPESPTEEWLVQALSEVLDREVIECSFERIGAAFGLAGETYAVTTGAASDAVRVAAKFERSEHTARAAWFLRGLGEVGVVPELMGAWFDDERGVLMTRLVEPAEQGDVLAGCSPKQARAVLRAIAEIHARNWGARLEHRFPGSLWETRRWRDRVATASARVPSLFDDEMTHWLLEEFPPALEAALGRLESSPQTGIQLDAHLDNVLWREDGSAVIVDWANACEGQPSIWPASPSAAWGRCASIPTGKSCCGGASVPTRPTPPSGAFPTPASHWPRGWSGGWGVPTSPSPIRDRGSLS
jgi:hypothetical protein